MKKYDYSEYELSENEEYKLSRSNNKYFNVNLFFNNVVFDDIKKETTIHVDCNFEPEEYYDEKLKLIENHPGFYNNRTGYDYAYRCRYSGESITSVLGQNLIKFCYSDISANMKMSLLFANFGDSKYNEKLSELYNETMGNSEKVNNKNESLKIKNSEEIFENKSDSYERFANIVNLSFEDIFYISLFPVDIKVQTVDAYIYYFNFLKMLQDEFKELIEFCLDVDANQEYFSCVSSKFKYKFYCMHIVKHQLKESFQEDWNFNKSFKYSSDETANLLQNMDSEKLKPTDFAKKYNLRPLILEMKKIYEYDIERSYLCRSLYDMLCLEFLKMIENNIRIKRCKNCEEYFILKGNYKTKYCYNIKDGQAKTCQQIASQKNYDNSVKKNPEIALYNKYYKKLFARKKVGTLKEKEFKLWKYKACVRISSDEEVCLERKTKINEYLPKYKNIKYTYDFGDNWVHNIEIEKVLFDFDNNHPICLEGKGDRPPEDVGGEGGYEEFMEIMRNPNHEEYEHMKEWYESQYYKGFNIDSVNRQLKHLY